MTIRHHLSDTLLMNYASGSLSEAFNLFAATHLSMCDACRAQVEAFEALGGTVIDQVDVAGMADNDIETAVDRITSTAPPSRSPPRPAARHRGAVPTPLADYIGGGLDQVKWRAMALGVRQSILPTAKGASARLLRIPAGREMPVHGHNGTELTMVLRGAFLDDGRRYSPGDVEISDQATEHAPVADVGEDCICLVASDATLKFSGLLPRLAQKFFRI